MNILKSFFILCLFFFSAVSIGNAQTESTEKNSKTMICKVKPILSKESTTLPSDSEIDNFLISKYRTGILSSKTDLNKGMITVEVEKNFTVEMLGRLLEGAFKLEIEKYEIINLSE